jgi:hypothetical protein
MFKEPRHIVNGTGDRGDKNRNLDHCLHPVASAPPLAFRFVHARDAARAESKKPCGEAALIGRCGHSHFLERERHGGEHRILRPFWAHSNFGDSISR